MPYFSSNKLIYGVYFGDSYKSIIGFVLLQIILLIVIIILLIVTQNQNNYV